MELSLLRIDDRLIHGQVATSWLKAYKTDAIFAVNDAVTNDQLRKTLLLQVAPPDVKSYVISVEKAIAVYNNPKYKDTKVLMLVTNPADVVRLVEGGVKVNSVNVGGMTFKEGNKLISSAVAIGKEDFEAFKKLKNMGIELEIRKLASHPKEDLAPKLDEFNLD
jgi:PTS system mannose-specific IIB component